MTLNIVPDNDAPYAILAAADEMGKQVAKVRVSARVKLTPASTWIENDFHAPRG